MLNFTWWMSSVAQTVQKLWHDKVLGRAFWSVNLGQNGPVAAKIAFFVKITKLKPMLKFDFRGGYYSTFGRKIDRFAKKCNFWSKIMFFGLSTCR